MSFQYASYEKESSLGGVAQSPSQDSRSKTNNIGDMQRYSRTPTAIESALSSNEPVKMDMMLFDSYKVASRLPYDIFKTICLKAV